MSKYSLKSVNESTTFKRKIFIQLEKNGQVRTLTVDYSLPGKTVYCPAEIIDSDLLRKYIESGSVKESTNQMIKKVAEDLCDWFNKAEAIYAYIDQHGKCAI